MADHSGPPNSEMLLENGYVRLKQCRHGAMLYISADEYVGRSLDLYGEFSQSESTVINQVLKPGMVAIDAGANIGCHTLSMARSVIAKGIIHAFEAQRIVHQILTANIALNAVTNVVSHHAALGATAGQIVVPHVDYSKTGNFGGLALGEFERGEAVAMETIDGLNLAACHFIKIDVEGMETDVLAGGAGTIDAHQPILYVENDRRERAPKLIEWLLNRDYRLYWHLPRLYNPDNFFGNDQNVFGKLISRNMFCLPKDSQISVTNFQEITSPDSPF